MYFGNYADLKAHATFAITSVSISLICIFINCMLLRFHYDIKYPFVYMLPITSKFPKELFITYGLIGYAAGGPALATPNVAVLVRDHAKFPRAIIWMFVVIFLLYSFSAFVPYCIFGKETRPMITHTFQLFYNRIGHDTAVPILTVICNISLALHFIVESVLAINPVFLHLESVLNIPTYVNWKRIAVRTVLIILVFGVAMAFPDFVAVLSLLGGVPFPIFVPMFIYVKLFDTTWITRTFFVVVTIIFLAFFVGNFIFSVEMLVDVAATSMSSVKHH